MTKNWTFILASDHKAIFASPDVVNEVRATIVSRDCKILEEETVEVASVDMPGMIRTDREWWTTTIDGLELSIPIIDFPDFLRQMRQAPYGNIPRDGLSPDRTYRSIYGWMHVIALSQRQYSMLLMRMSDEADVVNEKAYEEQEAMRSAVRQIKDESDHFEIPDFELSDDPVGGEWN